MKKKEYKITRREMQAIINMGHEESAIIEQEQKLIELSLSRRKKIRKKKDAWWKKQARKHGFNLEDCCWTAYEEDLTIRPKKGETLGTFTD